ncbi:MAG: DUF4153 domain-containing protein [Erythrobacter sp.]|nr:MAG: DUF4153 domain-containing protein [Erythrobacter sp.]
MSESMGESGVGTASSGHDQDEWPLRPWLLAALGALAGLAMWLLLDDGDTESPARFAGAAFVFFASVAAAFTLNEKRPLEAVIFSLLLGAVMGGVAFLVTDAGERLAGEEFALGAGVFFSVLAVPLFQAGFHRTRFATPYAETHFHVWSDAVSAGGAVAFMGLSWLLLWLLDALFGLIGINAIEDLIMEGWFPPMFIGATFGGALGVLRNQLSIIGTLQRVVMLVFALLAVPFAVALLIFLVILLASGGSALWDATDAATPVLLACAVGAFVLTNAVVRDDDEARSRNVVMQAAAIALAACILPLSLFAAISMGIRIDQYGLAPERIWALIAIVIACAYGVAYWAGLARGRLAAWSHYLRRANLHLAAVTCVVALLLALPLVDFGAVSARDQVARLESGKVTPEEFDYAALRWDFGDAGREALAELAEGEGEVADLATAAQAQTERPYDWERYVYDEVAEPRDEADLNFRLESQDETLRTLVVDMLRNEARCLEFCVVLDWGENDTGQREVAVVEKDQYWVAALTSPKAECVENGCPDSPPRSRPELTEDSTVEVRDVPTRYIFIDGQPAYGPFSFLGT